MNVPTGDQAQSVGSAMRATGRTEASDSTQEQRIAPGERETLAIGRPDRRGDRRARITGHLRPRGPPPAGALNTPSCARNRMREPSGDHCGLVSAAVVSPVSATARPSPTGPHHHVHVEERAAGIGHRAPIRRERGRHLELRVPGDVGRAAEYERRRLAAAEHAAPQEERPGGDRQRRAGRRDDLARRPPPGRKRDRVPGRAGRRRQRGRELRRRREAVGRELLRARSHRVFHVRRHGRPRVAHRRRRLGQHLGHDRLRGRPGERRLAGQHLVGHAAQRVDVAPGRDLALAHRLLGTHVVRRAERHPGLGHPAAARLARGQGDAEVGDQRLAVVQQDVLGLDVAVDHAVAVGVVERARHLGRDPERVVDRELLLPGQAVAERSRPPRTA